MPISRIRLRRGTAADWTAANPVLASGEPGVELDTGKQKIGDGAKAWAQLDYTATKGDPGPAGVADDASVKDLITTPGTETATALSATYVTADIPGGIANSDTINSWWSKPRSQYDAMRQRVYFTGVTRGGLMHVGYFDLRRGTARTFPLWAYEADDHCTPAILIEDTKPPIVIGTRHGMDNVVRIKVGTAPHSLDTLGATATIDFGRAVSYAQIIRKAGTDTIAVLARAEDGWWVSRSTDYGLTWGAPFRLYGLGYGTFRRSGNTIHYVVTTHPTSVVNNAIRYFKINATTGDITNAAGTAIDNLWTMTTVISGASMTYVRQSFDTDPMYNTSRVLDIGPSGSILALKFNKATPGSGGIYGVYRYATTGYIGPSSTSEDSPARGWIFEPIVASGVPALYDASAYVGGGEFTTTDNEVWLSREAAGTWYLEKYTKTGGAWAVTETRAVRTDGRKMGRPQVPQGGEDKGILTVGDYHFTEPANYHNYYADQLLLKP